MSICLLFYDCRQTTMVELNSRDRHHVLQGLKYFPHDPLQKSLLAPSETTLLLLWFLNNSFTVLSPSFLCHQAPYLSVTQTREKKINDTLYKEVS